MKTNKGIGSARCRLGLLAFGLPAAVFACRPAAIPTASPPVPARTPDVVFVPTPFRVVDAMLAVARVGAGDVLYDLGSGDGRIVIAAARRFGIRAVGIDIDPKRIEESRVNADTARVADRVDFRTADLFTTDLRPASVVTLYLLPALNVRLRPKLFEELRPGSRIVSHSFDMGEWKADSTMRIDARIVYYWLMPADVSGTWNVTVRPAGSMEQTAQLQFEQKYQNITRAETTDGWTVDNASVRGDSVYFVLRGASPRPLASEFRGKVTGDSIAGTVTISGTTGTWVAARTRRRSPP